MKNKSTNFICIVILIICMCIGLCGCIPPKTYDTNIYSPKGIDNGIDSFFIGQFELAGYTTGADYNICEIYTGEMDEFVEMLENSQAYAGKITLKDCYNIDSMADGVFEAGNECFVFSDGISIVVGRVVLDKYFYIALVENITSDFVGNDGAEVSVYLPAIVLSEDINISDNVNAYHTPYTWAELKCIIGDMLVDESQKKFVTKCNVIDRQSGYFSMDCKAYFVYDEKTSSIVVLNEYEVEQ